MDKKALAEEKTQGVQLFARLLDFTQDGVYRYTFAEGTILFANSGFVRILDLDFAPGEVAGKRLRDLLTYTDEPGTIRKHADAQGEIHNFEYHFKTLKGAERWVLHDSFVTLDPKTGVKVVEAFVRDITERKRSEAALRDSEERQRFALEISGIGAWDLDLADHTAFRSLEHDRIFGYAELLPRWTYEMFLEHVLPEDRTLVGDKFRRAVATESDWNFECRIRRSDGQVRWIWAAGRHQRNAAGAARRMAGIVQDITERKQATEALAAERQRLAITLRSIGDGVIVTDGQGRVTLLNQVAETLTGWAEPEARGKPLAEVFRVIDERTRQPGVDPVRGALREGRVQESANHTALVARDGTERSIADSAAPILDQEGKVIGAVLTFRDVTERKRAEEQVRRLNVELEERVARRTAQLKMAVEELEAFSYSVSHDLRAPLRAMDGFSQALLEDYPDRLDARGRDYLSRVRGGAQRMSQLIDGFLKLSRAGRAELLRKAVDLGALARDAAEDLRRSNPGREVEFTASGDLRAEGDVVLLRIVLDNLLDNAWKFTTKTAQAKVEFGAALGAAPSAAEKVFYVRDNGAGFDAARVGKLFGAFQRLHSIAEFPGSGIGLATVRRIIHRHGGRVWAEGAVGKGATFYFTLPPRPDQEGR